MNIKITHSWLKEFLETDAKPEVIAEKLSLCSLSVERLSQVNNDWVYDIEITSNRPDAASLAGIARELSAILPQFKISAKFKSPQYQKVDYDGGGKLPLKVKIKDKSLVPRFSALIFDSCEIKPSQKWMQQRLENSEIRAINNIVDIANYVMLETGQPMHTFDYDKISRAEMYVRKTADGEQIVTLDGIKRSLPSGTIVISDSEKLIDLCGIMGGENSQITADTKRVVLFVQVYNPARIRSTSQKIGLRTEASSRFEKGIDAEGVLPALFRASNLIQKSAGAKVASKLIDIYPNPTKSKKVLLTFEKLYGYLGCQIEPKTVAEILDKLGFDIKLNKSALKAAVPSWRSSDIQIDVDLIEEIARVAGYFKLPSELLTGEIPIRESKSDFFWEQKVKQALKFSGYTEIYSYSLISKKLLADFEIDLKEAIKLKNPLTAELEFLRPSLLPSHLSVIAQNQNLAERLKFFELANIYLPKEDSLPEEKTQLIITTNSADFYTLKGDLESVFLELAAADYNFSQEQKPNFVIGKTAQISIDNQILGVVGQIKTEICKKFKVAGEVYAAVLDFSKLISAASTTPTYKSIPKFSAIEEDISMIVNRQTEIGQISKIIKEAGGHLLTQVQSFDIFEDKKIGPGKKSVAFHLYYQDPNRQLTSVRIKAVREEIIRALENKLGAKVRLKEMA